MARRSISTLFLSLLVAVMVGIRESTGLAPPPPMLGTEEIEWLSPEREDNPGLFIVFEDPEPTVAPTTPEAPRRAGALHRLLALFRPAG